MQIAKKLILGSANFSTSYGILKNKVSKHQIKKILNYAKKRGVQFLELSKDYNNTNLKYLNSFSKFKLFKKIDLSSNYLKKNIRNNLILYLSNNKNIKKFCYGVTIRKPDLLLKSRGKFVYDILHNLKKNKKIKKIGITIYNTRNLKKIIKNFKIDYIQLPLNLVNYKIFYDVKKIIKKKNIELHARSIFLQGILLKNSDQLPNILKNLKNYWLKIDNKLKKEKITRYSACLNFILNCKVDKILFGVNNKNQIKELLNFKTDKKKIPTFKIKQKSLIDPIEWLKYNKNYKA